MTILIICSILFYNASLDKMVFANTIISGTEDLTTESTISSTTLSEEAETEDKIVNDTSESIDKEIPLTSDEVVTELPESSEITNSSDSVILKSNESSSINNSNEDTMVGTQSVTDSGTWGTASYEFEESTGLMRVGSGEITEKGQQPWSENSEYRNKIKKIVFTGPLKMSGNSGADMFYNLRNLVIFEGMANIDTAELTSMERMFSQAKSLIKLDVSSFDTSKVKSISQLFFGCDSLNELDISNFDFSNVTSGITYFPRNLAKVTFGESLYVAGGYNVISFTGPANIPHYPNTGKWIKEDFSSKAYTPKEFIDNYGKGDLTPGTYIGEPVPSLLNSTIEFDKEEGIVGQSLSTNIIIKNISKVSIQSISVTIKKFLDSDLLKQDVFEFNKYLILERYDSNNKLIDSERKPFSNEEISLKDLAVNQYYKINISGTIWDTSMKTTDGNYEFSVHYKDPAYTDVRKQDNKGYYKIRSGSFGFNSVPKNINFEDTVLKLPVKETIINREPSSWEIKVYDYRGTIGLEEGQKEDRRDWEIVASAERFKSSSGGELDSSVLTIVYRKKGIETNLSTGSQAVIFTHRIAGETPKANNQTVLSWDNTEGIFAKVFSAKGIETGETYHSSVTLELRSAP